jgi:predicted secreted protein
MEWWRLAAAGGLCAPRPRSPRRTTAVNYRGSSATAAAHSMAGAASWLAGSGEASYRAPRRRAAAASPPVEINRRLFESL